MKTNTATENSQQRALPISKETMLAALRCGRARVSLLAFEIDEIGILLKQNLITVEQARDDIEQLGALDIVFMRGIGE